MKLSLVLIIFIFISCSQRIKVPINRFLEPEAIGGGFEMEYRDMGFSSGVLDFTDNNTNNPLTMGTSRDQEFYAGFGLSRTVDMFVRVPEESSSLVGLKVQIIGNPTKEMATGHNLAFTVGMGSERDTFDQIFTIDLKSDVTDYSLVHGFRFNDKLLLYDGLSLSNYQFQGTIQGTTELNSNEIDYVAKNILGGHVGIMFGGANFNIKLETAVQKIEWTNTQSKLFQHFGLALSAGW